MTTYIYGLQDPINGLIRYIGKSVSPADRLKMHIFYAGTNLKRWREETHKAHWIRQLLQQGKQPILVVLEEVQGANWQDRERFWINHFERLTNISNGGDGVDAPRTEIWRARIGSSHKGKTIPQEMRDRLRAANLEKNKSGCKRGHPWTPENTITVTRQEHTYRLCRTCNNQNQRNWRARNGLVKGRRKILCEKGHALSGDNLRILIRNRNGKVHEEHICRQCVRDRNHKYKQQNRRTHHVSNTNSNTS